MSSDVTADTAGGDVVRGWKEIAAHLHASVRTVQRWEDAARLPVKRVDAGTGVIVFASRRDLDAWIESADGRAATRGSADVPSLAPEAPAQSIRGRRRMVMIAATVGIVLIVPAALALSSRMTSSGSAAGAAESGPGPTTVATVPAQEARPAFVYVKLYFESGSVGTVGIPRGGAATIGIKDRGQYALSADIERDGALLHFTTVSDLSSANVVDEQVASRLFLHPHTVTPVKDVPGVASVELFPPGVVPGQAR